MARALSIFYFSSLTITIRRSIQGNIHRNVSLSPRLNQERSAGIVIVRTFRVTCTNDINANAIASRASELIARDTQSFRHWNVTRNTAAIKSREYAA